MTSDDESRRAMLMNDDMKLTMQWRWAPRAGMRGFTLVELMIVIALVAMMAAFAVPTLSSSMERNRLNQLNRDVGNAFLQSRSHAMRNGQAVYVDLSTNNRLRFYEPGSGGDWDAPTCALADDQGPDDDNTIFDIQPELRGVEVEIQTSDPNVNRVCISPNGRVLDSNGRPLQASASGCDQMNLLIPIYESDGQGQFDYCDEDDVVDRDLYNFSMIHVAYGGQVRVIQ